VVESNFGETRGHAAEGDSRGELARLHTILARSGDIVYDWDLASDQISWAGSVAQLFNGSVSPPLTGETLNGHISPVDLPRRKRALSAHFAGSRPYDCEYRLRTAAGDFEWVHDRGAVECSPSGTPMRLCGLIRLVTERKMGEARLQHRANYDELTGHFNKVRLRESLDHSLEWGLRYGLTGAFLAFGLDQLGRTNSAYGYEAGDAVLVETGRRLDECLRSADIIGRMGSDRFGIILGQCSEDEAIQTAERLVTTMRARAIEIGGTDLNVTASVGVVMFPEQAKTSLDVITKAENALLKAKVAGRDCAIAYDLTEEQRRHFRASMETGASVAQALKEGRLFFEYQPIVDAASHEVRHHECLLRIRANDGAVITAGEFVPVIERLGMVRTVDRNALALSLDNLEHYSELSLAVNISGITVADRGWMRSLVSRLKENTELAQRLIVEITETTALHDIEESVRFVSAVRALGCQVAIDDFGSGYTSFHHLKSMTVDIVKIDGSFVRDIANNQQNQLFVRNLLHLAETLKVSTIAECVECLEDAAWLKDAGVDLLQGYYFGRPTETPATTCEVAAQPPEFEADRRASAGRTA
jgi:diguanylate cyclase (GGDEF)-like protein